MLFETNLSIQDQIFDLSQNIANNSLDLSPKQQAVLEILIKIDPLAADAYKTGLFFFKTETFPLRKYLICYTFYLLFEIFTKADEQAQSQEFQNHITDTLKQAIKINNWFEDSVCNNFFKQDSTKKQIKSLWEKLVEDSKGKGYRWHYFIKRFRPKIPDENLYDLVEMIKKAMKQFHSGRHFNQSRREENQDFSQSIEAIENLVLQLEQPYIEAKEVLDDILEQANTTTD